MINYRVKVRGITYLWGGKNIRVGFDAESAVYIHCRVDEAGEDTAIFITKLGDNPTNLGKLKPGECITIRLEKGITGIHAAMGDNPSVDDPVDTFMDCTVLCAADK